jgi:proline racemase
MKEPITVLHIDTPAGLVKATAQCKDGKCERVSLDMNPSFAIDLDVKIDVDGIGQVMVDIAFGGVFYGLIDVAQFNMDIAPNNARQLVEIGTKIHRAINRGLVIKHPKIIGLEGLSYTMFTGFNSDGEMQGATILPPGRIDRSPCGTGNSARLAVMYARGQIGVNEKRTARSIINSYFDVEITGLKSIGGVSAILPNISGRGWIFGKHEIGIDPNDPYLDGYSVSDCWGDAFDLMSNID